MNTWIKQFRTEDWVVTAVSAVLLLLAALIPGWLPKIPKSLVTPGDWQNTVLLYALVLATLAAGWLLLGKPLKGIALSLVAVFAVSLLAQITASIPAVAYYGFESVFFSVLFGLLIRNLFHIPAWLKPAIQSEYFIKIGVVCLGATILFSDVMKSGAVGLLQAILVVGIVWFFAYWVSRRMGVDQRSAMILSSGLSICGVSACITAARVAGGDDRKLSYIISLVLIIVVPMIYLMPWLAGLILPLLFDDPATVQEVAGAWIGGTVDTTSGVAASSAIVSDLANQHAVIIKGAQNVLIGVVAFFIALYLYHLYILPRPTADRIPSGMQGRNIWLGFGQTIVSFFTKPRAWAAVLFMLLYRLPEAQLAKLSNLFLIDAVSEGGLGLTTQEVGFVQGTVGVIGLLLGGIIGGIAASRHGLKHWLWPMVWAISLPDLVYVYLSYAQPDSLWVISSCIFVEQLGYGFGFTAYMLYLIYYSQGEQRTAHYAICTAFMALGMMLPGMVAGKLQELMGYEHFFIWVMVCCVATFAVTALLKIDPEFGKKGRA